MVVIGLAAAVTYRALATGGIWTISALLMLAMGLLLGGVRGLFAGMIFIIPTYVLLYYPVPPQSAEFGTLLLALAVFLGVVPMVFVALGLLLKRAIGALVAALLIVPGYITFLIFFPMPLGPGALPSAALLFGGFGMAFGFLWGIGFASPGASAHEGPGYYAQLEALDRPRIQPVRQVMAVVRTRGPEVRDLIAPLIRPLITALVVAGALVGAVLFVAANPIVPVSVAQTRDSAANAAAVTGEKFILFVVIAAVILGAVVTLAFLLALGINALNRQINEAKKVAPEPVAPQQFRAFRVADFFITWVNDVLTVFRRSGTR